VAGREIRVCLHRVAVFFQCEIRAASVLVQVTEGEVNLCILRIEP
jgi:hypothetical protein